MIDLPVDVTAATARLLGRCCNDSKVTFDTPRELTSVSFGDATLTSQWRTKAVSLLVQCTPSSVESRTLCLRPRNGSQ